MEKTQKRGALRGNFSFVRIISELIRPYQYTKNLFIFLPAFFAFQIDDVTLLGRTFLAFVAFSLISGAVYTLNDWIDRFDDARHPEKKHRPIASGRITKKAAFGVIAVMLSAGLLLSAYLGWAVFGMIAGYFVLFAMYSYKLKHFPIIDISLIGVGFVLRLFVGSEVTDVVLSPWIIVMTFLLALFLALGKRRDDVLIFQKTDQKMRRAVDGYNLKFLDVAMVMTAAVIVPSYILWTFSTEIADRLTSNNLYLTSFFVIAGLLRFMQVTYVQQKSGNPSLLLLRDRYIPLILLGWVTSLLWILYL